jgi:hypothetical protein
MKRQETASKGCMNQEALRTLVERIKARQTRQTELWRRPMQPTTVSGAHSAESAAG